MLVSHRDDLTVICGDFVQVSDTLEERRTVRHDGPRAVFGEREHRDRPSCCGEHVDALVAAFEWQPDQGVPGNATAPGHLEPNRPVWVAIARRAFGAVRDLVNTPAPVPAPVRFPVLRMIRGQLFRPGTRVLVVALWFLPPAELREVQGVDLSQPCRLDFLRPAREIVWEVKSLSGHTPPGLLRAYSLRAHPGVTDEHLKVIRVDAVVAAELVGRKLPQCYQSVHGHHGNTQLARNN